MFFIERFKRMKEVKTFPRGVHPKGNKHFTADKEIEVFSAKEKIFVSTSQHIGAKAVPIVKVGDHVLRGQKIAEKAGVVSANVFSPISGQVFEIAMRNSASGGRVEHIGIINDFKNEEVYLEKLENPSKEQLLDRLVEAGIVGMGGATFPSNVKFSPKEKAEVLIVNGAECEPYINCDNRIMQEKTAEFVGGVKFLAQILEVDEIVIGIEENKPRAIEKVSAFDGIKVVALKAKYPQGSEKQLIYACTRRVVENGKLPISAGAVVVNAHTAFCFYESVSLGKPCFERVVTVSGNAVKEPKNILVPTGVPFEELLRFCGGIKENEECVKVVSGGTMMGFAQFDLSPVVTKGTSALLFLTDKEICLEKPSQCINCAKCQSVCPMHLMPMYIDGFGQVGDAENAKKYGALDCMECGSCTFICPAKRPIIQGIRKAKKIIRAKGV